MLQLGAWLIDHAALSDVLASTFDIFQLLNKSRTLAAALRYRQQVLEFLKPEDEPSPTAMVQLFSVSAVHCALPSFRRLSGEWLSPFISGNAFRQR